MRQNVKYFYEHIIEMNNNCFKRHILINIPFILNSIPFIFMEEVYSDIKIRGLKRQPPKTLKYLYESTRIHKDFIFNNASKQKSQIINNTSTIESNNYS